MSYITDLFDTHWDSDIVDRTDKVKAQKERLAKSREAQEKKRLLTAGKNKKAPATTKI